MTMATIDARPAGSEQPASVTEILPGCLYAISGWVPASRRLSWIPASAKGWIPLQCYVMRDGDEAVLVDTGAGGIADAVRSGLNYVLAGTKRRTLWITRREFDATANMPWVLPDMKINLVKCGGDFDPMNFFASFDDANAKAQMEAAMPPGSRPDSGLIQAGEVLRVGSLKLTAMKTNLQVLRAFWFVEETTGTLFCSDSFGLLFCDSPAGPLVRPPGSGRFTADDMYDYLIGRFKWMQGARMSAIGEEVAAVIDNYDVQRLCPSWGCVIEGRDDVAHAVRELRKALARLEREPRVPVVTNEFLHSLGTV